MCMLLLLLCLLLLSLLVLLQVHLLLALPLPLLVLLPYPAAAAAATMLQLTDFFLPFNPVPLPHRTPRLAAGTSACSPPWVIPPASTTSPDSLGMCPGLAATQRCWPLQADAEHRGSKWEPRDRQLAALSRTALGRTCSRYPEPRRRSLWLASLLASNPNLVAS